MYVEINLDNYSENVCTCKYVHAVQNYIVQIRRERDDDDDDDDDSKLK